MWQRLAMVMVYLSTIMVPAVTAERPSVSRSALGYLEGHGELTTDQFLERLRPMPVDDGARARVLAALPPHGTVRAGSRELAKMSLAEEVLAYHHRRDRITFTIIDVAPAFIGLHERAVILVSARALSLVNTEEFAALVAHEIGHEFVWKEYQLAVERRDHDRIRELELRCDGIAVLTLRRLGLDAERLVSAVNAARSASPCSRSSITSRGSAAASTIGCISSQRLRFCRLSKRRRSIARERAWFMIQPSTVPFAAS